jgi:hypothetical protein
MYEPLLDGPGNNGRIGYFAFAANSNYSQDIKRILTNSKVGTAFNKYFDRAVFRRNFYLSRLLCHPSSYLHPHNLLTVLTSISSL